MIFVKQLFQNILQEISLNPLNWVNSLKFTYVFFITFTTENMIIDIFNSGMSFNSITEKANGVNNSIGLGLASLFADGHFLSTIKLFLWR